MYLLWGWVIECNNDFFSHGTCNEQFVNNVNVQLEIKGIKVPSNSLEKSQMCNHTVKILV